ncbi:hypothetical protein ACOSQ2_009704 [Xanthoceras sorbifolium]|uniref:RING-type domain-containing protein n=1 Tax=Xanthoceras sorbifolium TaxID=99658 RepID=A0ABQ8HV64_9ROSI|nr:hypothetical protein JRO89_XS07G0247700 [Xanthoceras sorbifolium]
MAVNRFLSIFTEEITISLPNPCHPPVCDVHISLKHRFRKLLRSSSSSSVVLHDYTVSDDPLPPVRIPLTVLPSPLLCNLHVSRTISTFNLDGRLRDFLSRYVTRASVDLCSSGSVGFRLVACVEVLNVDVIDACSLNSSLMMTKRLAAMAVVEKLSRQQRSATDDQVVGPCAVCLEEFSSSGGAERTITLPCSHVFHQSCICRWLEEQNSCPMCRRVIQADDFYVDQDFVVCCGPDDTLPVISSSTAVF